METILDFDLNRSASLAHMAAHFPAPFAAATAMTEVVPDATGLLSINWQTREPLLLAAAKKNLTGEGLKLNAVLTGASALDGVLDFAPYTEAGAMLPLYQPSVNTDTEAAVPFSLQLSVIKYALNQIDATIPVVSISDNLRFFVVEGRLGRLTYLLSAEKARIRREVRKISAMRQLSLAQDDALDRIGASYGVLRFSDDITYDKVKKEIVTVIRTDAGGKIENEPDEEYRRRLLAFTQLRVPTPLMMELMLNGPGGPADPNTGLLKGLGFSSRFTITEEDNDFSVAVKLISVGNMNYVTNFIQYIRTVHLIWPQATNATNSLHKARFLPSTDKVRITALRQSLRGYYTFPASTALAPMLALALERLGGCLKAMGQAAKVTVKRAQDTAGGSRYELGLGVDVTPLTSQQITGFYNFLMNPNRAANADTRVEVLLQSMQPVPFAQDKEAFWLFNACGFKTVHRVDTQTLYLSHLPVFGMAITGPLTMAANTDQVIEVRYHAPGDPGQNVVLQNALSAAGSAWTAAGNMAWTVLTAAQTQTAFGHVVVHTAAEGVLRSAGLSVSSDPADIVVRIGRLPTELYACLRLPVALAQSVIGGQVAAVGKVSALVSMLQSNGIVSVLPLITNLGEILLVTAVIGLPEAGLNLNDKRATGFRWYAVHLNETEESTISPIGSRTVFTPKKNGLYALVAVGYARRGLTDPYEFRVDLPQASNLLNIKQYEFLMNLLGLCAPMGVEVNTYALRHNHVDLDEDGTTDPLPPRLSRTYRAFRRKRQKGEMGTSLMEELE